MIGLPEIIRLNNLAAENGDRAVLALIRRQRIEERPAGLLAEKVNPSAAHGTSSYLPPLLTHSLNASRSNRHLFSTIFAGSFPDLASLYTERFPRRRYSAASSIVRISFSSAISPSL